MRVSSLAVVLFVGGATACGSPNRSEPTHPSELPGSTTSSTTSPPATPAPDVYDLETLGVPRFVESAYISPVTIARVSRFRSGIGHDYSDATESCRSMKHYMQPAHSVKWESLPILAPVSGRVAESVPEWAGVQLRIEPSGMPAFRVILFHVVPAVGIGEGSLVAAGQTIGTHVGAQTMSDVAISVNTPSGFRLVSYFDALTDAAYDAYRARGIPDRASAIISRAARDGQPLSCTGIGSGFADSGLLENWLDLR